MTEMDWNGDDDIAPSRWIPHLFALAQKDATQVEARASDILKNHLALEALLNPWEKEVLSNPEYNDFVDDPMADANPPPTDAPGSAAGPGSSAPAVAPT
eukprot:3754647-Pyramimonas_sp.AAC.1